MHAPGGQFFWVSGMVAWNRVPTNVPWRRVRGWRSPHSSHPQCRQHHRLPWSTGSPEPCAEGHPGAQAQVDLQDLRQGPQWLHRPPGAAGHRAGDCLLRGGGGQAPGQAGCWRGALGLEVERGIGIIQSVLSNYHEIKLEINYKRRMRKSPSVWKSRYFLILHESKK